MNLPNYFLADLPDDAPLNAAMITEACQTLRRNRAQYLAGRSTPGLIRMLHSTAENWLAEDYPFRQLALKDGPAQTGFSAQTLAHGLDDFFKQLTAENLDALLVQELGHAQRLDEFTANSGAARDHRAALARGPELLVHIAGGSLPNPTLTSIVLGLLTRSAQFVKCPRGGAFLPRLFAHSLYDSEPKLGACLEIAAWPGGSEALEAPLFAEADCVTATGTDETLAKIQSRLPAKTRFLGHGHKVSFGFVSKEALHGYNTKKIISRAASDVVAWDQLGCLSPHVFYVQAGGTVAPEQFAEQLAAELAHREATGPRRQLSAEAAAGIAARRALYEVRAAHSPDSTRHWCSPDSTAWTVVFESDPLFQVSCLNRFIYVKGVRDLTDALNGADAVQGKTSTVGIAAPEHLARELARELARWGVTRVCPLGEMQNPPLAWRHDGRPSFGDMVTWTDWEQ
ncbi:MAG: hypothetical protein HZA89_02865 [Verrucomicrobia bacterium]|nr:hypothetical protein [Verrucomicrobiota bacterium]